MIVYKIIYKPENKIVYIGYTSFSPEKRFNQHCQKSQTGSDLNIHKFIREKGKENFDIKKLCSCSSISNLRKMERFFIKKFDTFSEGLNMNPGGGGVFKHSDETKKKIAKNNIGNKNMLGKRHSDETKEILRKKSTGKSHITEEGRKRLSESSKGNTYGSALKGKPHSDEWNRKVGEANKGKKRTDEQNEANRERCLGRIPWNKGVGKKAEYLKQVEIRKKLREDKRKEKHNKVKKKVWTEEAKQKLRDKALKRHEDGFYVEHYPKMIRK